MPVLFVLSCQKQTRQYLSPLHSVSKPALCLLDTAALRSNMETSKLPDAYGRRKPAPTPTPTPTPIPTGSGYSCIFLDFDGQTVNSPYWNGGSTLQCDPAGLSATQIAAVVSKVTAAYSRYNVTVTDNESVYLSANPYMRIRVIVTPTSSWWGGVSGITYSNSFTWGDETPSFVFSDRLFFVEGYIGEIASHEAGHSLGLNHQTDYDAYCQLISSYRLGVIMGNSLYVPDGTWTYGTSLSCTTYQDDNQVLTNKLGLRY